MLARINLYFYIYYGDSLVFRAHTADSSIGRAEDCSRFVCYLQVAGSIPAQQIFLMSLYELKKNRLTSYIILAFILFINNMEDICLPLAFQIHVTHNTNDLYLLDQS